MLIFSGKGTSPAKTHISHPSLVSRGCKVLFHSWGNRGTDATKRPIFALKAVNCIARGFSSWRWRHSRGRSTCSSPITRGSVNARESTSKLCNLLRGAMNRSSWSQYNHPTSAYWKMQMPVSRFYYTRVMKCGHNVLEHTPARSYCRACSLSPNIYMPSPE